MGSTSKSLSLSVLTRPARTDADRALSSPQPGPARAAHPAVAVERQDHVAARLMHRLPLHCARRRGRGMVVRPQRARRARRAAGDRVGGCSDPVDGARTGCAARDDVCACCMWEGALAACGQQRRCLECGGEQLWPGKLPHVSFVQGALRLNVRCSVDTLWRRRSIHSPWSRARGWAARRRS